MFQRSLGSLQRPATVQFRPNTEFVLANISQWGRIFAEVDDSGTLNTVCFVEFYCQRFRCKVSFQKMFFILIYFAFELWRRRGSIILLPIVTRPQLGADAEFTFSCIFFSICCQKFQVEVAPTPPSSNPLDVPLFYTSRNGVGRSDPSTNSYEQRPCSSIAAGPSNSNPVVPPASSQEQARILQQQQQLCEVIFMYPFSSIWNFKIRP